MNWRRGKRMTTARFFSTPEKLGGEPDAEYAYLVPKRLERLARLYDKRDLSQCFEHDPVLKSRMVAVLRRKPRAGRRRG